MNSGKSDFAKFKGRGHGLCGLDRRLVRMDFPTAESLLRTSNGKKAGDNGLVAACYLVWRTCEAVFKDGNR